MLRHLHEPLCIGQSIQRGLYGAGRVTKKSPKRENAARLPAPFPSGRLRQDARLQRSQRRQCATLQAIVWLLAVCNGLPQALREVDLSWVTGVLESGLIAPS